MDRQNVYGGTPWEPRVAYSRAVRIGNIVAVSGTVAVDETGAVVGTNLYEQTRYALKKIERALHEAGATLSDVVRIRTFLIDVARSMGLEHYSWGEGCDGWHLVNHSDLSVIQERMPPGTAEVRHAHPTVHGEVFGGHGVRE